MVNSLENIDKSKVSADRITGLDQKIQEELSTAVTGAASTIMTSDLTANKILVSNSNGKVAASTITSTDIDKVFSYYGTCSTAAATQTKDVVCSGFVLKTGSSIRVKFTNYQNYNGVFKLNVNSTGAKEVKRYGTTNTARYDFRAGEVISFTYDGTYWLMEDEGLADTTYFGKTKLTASATSTSTSLALTPSALNSYAQNTIANYPVYSTSSTYAVGDRVRYNWQTWECNTAITTAESWNASHWTALLDLQTQIDNIGSSSGSSRNIGEIIQSTVPLVDAGLHLLDGSIIQRGSYTAFVDYIAGLVSSYPDLFTTENDWQSSVLSYGVCGKFVYDSTNNTVRLPKYSNKIYTSDFVSSTPVVGNGYGLTLTNGSQTFAIAHDSDSACCAIGATNQSYVSVGTSTTRFSTQQALALGVPTASQMGNDLSVSGLIAVLSNITTSLEGYYYIVIATTTKTDIQVDIDQIATDLNAKADKSEFGDLDIVHVIVETYVNGTAWYRLYDDGWVEQGDYLAWSGAWTTVNLLKNFMNTNYTVLGGGARTDSSPYQAIFNFKDYTTSSFSIWSSDDSTSNPAACKWYACGYGE